VSQPVLAETYYERCIMAESRKWELVNPEGTVPMETGQANPHTMDLKGKTVVLQWNGKHNGDVFLNRIGELLTEKIKDLKVIKWWEIEPETTRVTQNSEASKKTAQKLAELKPDMVIAAQGD
jgi:hypothetical protein